MKQCINSCAEWFAQRSKKQQQWLWFIGLWCGGLGAVIFLALIIRKVMGIH